MYDIYIHVGHVYRSCSVCMIEYLVTIESPLLLLKLENQINEISVILKSHYELVEKFECNGENYKGSK